MPSPFHQKYSSQSHKWFGENAPPSTIPEDTKQESERRASDASTGSTPSSPTQRRRSSAAQRFGNLEALKRPADHESTERRSSLQDSYGKPGFLGTMWNNYTRGPAGQSPPAAAAPKKPHDTTTLSQ